MQMRRINRWNQWLAIPALIFLLGIGNSGEIAADDSEDAETSSASAKRLIDSLSSPEITAAEMEKAEAQLQDMAPQVVIPVLLPKIAQGMPGGFGIYNGSGSAKGDADAPPRWRAFYAYHRVWDKVAPRDSKLTGQLLAKGIAAAKTSKEQSALISQLNGYWDDAAENSLDSIMGKFRGGKSDWLAAARYLLLHKRSKYYDPVKQIAKQLPNDNWQQMHTKSSVVQLLLSDRAKARRRNEIGALNPVPLPRLDSDLVAIGFRLLKAMEGHEKGFGYFLALELGDYVGENFAPNRQDGNYDAENGLKKKYFADCSQNALDWWQVNKRKYVPAK